MDKEISKGMCGIAAVFSKKQHTTREDLDLLLNKISHRGELSFESAYFARCSLGTNRLPIVDPESGTQPKTDEYNNVYGILNGEIYNYQKLRRYLLGNGHLLTSTTDTEILVHLWEELGPKMLNYLDGMFSFIIYDKKNDYLFAARDFLGIKPLYWTKENDKYFFSSELKSFSPKKLQSLNELKPGYYFLNGKVNQYYNNKPIRTNKSFDEAKNTFKHLLISSVNKRVNTSLPIAVFYSGGIDSTIILKLASKFHYDITAITVGFKNSPDLEVAKTFCEENNINHIAKEITQEEFKKGLQSTLYYLESYEPNLVRGGVFSFLMSKIAKKNGFRIALSGEGADEILCGYEDFSHLKREKINDYSFTLTNDLYRTQLFRLDRCTMANTVETRVPYLDQRLVQFALGLQSEFKISEGSKDYSNKFILREAFKKELPEYIYKRKKIPMDEGAVERGPNELEEVFFSQIRGVKNQINNSPVDLSTEEEFYYYQAFKDFKYLNPISLRRIKVRNF